jgi:hypothetical protein
LNFFEKFLVRYSPYRDGDEQQTFGRLLNRASRFNDGGNSSAERIAARSSGLAAL